MNIKGLTVTSMLQISDVSTMKINPWYMNIVVSGEPKSGVTSTLSKMVTEYVAVTGRLAEVVALSFKGDFKANAVTTVSTCKELFEHIGARSGDTPLFVFIDTIDELIANSERFRDIVRFLSDGSACNLRFVIGTHGKIPQWHRSQLNQYCDLEFDLTKRGD